MVHGSCAPFRRLALLLELLDAGLKEVVRAWEARRMQVWGVRVCVCVWGEAVGVANGARSQYLISKSLDRK